MPHIDIGFKMFLRTGVPQNINCDEKKLDQIIVLLTNSLVRAIPSISQLVLTVSNIESLHGVKVIPFKLTCKFPEIQKLST